MDKTLGTLLVVFFLSFTLFVTVVFFNKPIAKFTRAKEDFLPSSANSLIFAYPLTVKADGITESTINVFVRSDKGIPVKEQKVTLASTVGSIKENEASTDDQGKATFHLSSSSKGVAEIEVMIGGSLKLNQKLSVKFE
ncbi:hypothetical protein A2334_05610 [Candidatus Roizmanbacteria bacterium RIFOXYB2_FULL_38_10]|uniref:Big-1 domain-containing protein n=1 Tax=Candidatus Roizmanbacteria bacterium RIFOXYD1_FULL_38_12 TaxID=1802093 RepID=A0A1F7L0T0_9BACT|nr:MAG: hypothetical protein A3K47_02730 [Candidatus Roizmanbacteria bacterium RIFOXYA2_FULL_38_14]OGK63683.1 MAG: hypothetical protein A3K27_02730 [Candidatus Roizmanbacteria bacterium RIFOXYA1_FULL_37_12]OGK65529.1 MAG: hypothetical protein A3K38_02730 [Candidatus Roizmanbacteria bacterium RIFOXYB1_FULL_40_23]OGK68313.1 MAG: hypothetical protein A2334_05610 [Candidatus Roizmanbacteria bacterium RIFOXYB2_FULL_38_10]OGK69934.1 MAG: hypothetical protein A3K21_02735 [Candidatus Roizmanbacteria ba